MTDQPGDILDEAVRLLGGLRGRLRAPDGGARPGEDVWGRAVRDESPHGAAAECRHCPLCRTMAAVRESGDAGRHLLDAARSLLAAAHEVLDHLERSRAPREGGGPREGSGGDSTGIG